MDNKCPSCGAEMRAEAKYCDQCATPLTPEVADKPKSAGVNWTALAILALAIAAIAWLLLLPKSPEQPGTMATATGNPHGTSGGQMGSSSGVSPHGMGSDTATGMPDFEQLRANLAADPLDVESLATLYQTYGMIGRAAQVRPELDAAMAALAEQREELGDDFETKGMELSLIALQSGDIDGGLAALDKLIELTEGSGQSLLLTADVYARLDDPAKAIGYYDRYLESADPVADGAIHEQALVNRALAMVALADTAETPDQAQLGRAVNDLTQITTGDGASFEAWLGLGKAYYLLSESDKAIVAYEQARQLATDDTMNWQVDSGLAEVRGEEPPEPPASAQMGGGMGSPHGGMGGSSGMANPHGSMSNPHGSVGDGTTDG
ncbi:tetratricopeptide repeat protein [bacterium]|nr:tetratricopeptide repeat protein [bacterium]